MKIRNSLRSLRTRHRANRLVRRKGRVFIINKTVPALQGPSGLRLFVRGSALTRLGGWRYPAAMRIVIGILAGALLLSGTALLGFAEEATPPSIAPVQPDKPAPSRSERLDGLFATLKSAKSVREAKVAESSILGLWLESGSDTVDLLMDWAIKAIDAKNYSLALDYLDRVVTMKPDYAEGWNKRATVYFLIDDYKKSIFDIERTLALEPRHFGALSGLGMIMRDISQDKRAIDAFQRALAVDPYLDNVKKALDDIQGENAGKEI